MDARRAGAELAALSIGANDPITVARFWGTALRWDVQPQPNGQVWIEPTDGTSFNIVVQPIPEAKVGPNRLHIDLTTSSDQDQRETVAQLLASGGSHLDIGQGDVPWVVLADPEGNELCVIEPDNGFLAGCPRLGSISCDGSEAVGRFWSAALGWPLVWDQDGETAIQAPGGTGPKVTWGGPPVAPKAGKNRWHLDVAPSAGASQDAVVERLLELGAERIDIGQGEVAWVVLADPDGNELCVLPAW